jgi:hypothetical protein
MTFRPSAPHKRSRWLALLVVATTLLVLAAGFAFAHGVEDVPARYAGGTQVDSDPPPAPSVNDVPGQVDMTQMGRDTSVNPNVRIFWSWDAISAWTGKGQTGDACALFDDDDADANIDYVVCARVSNTNADPALTEIIPASANHPAYLFDCSNAKNDRCTQPTPRAYTAGQVLAGPLEATPNLTQSGAGNLQNETDPFDSSVANGPGEAYPHDTSIEIEVASSLVPTGVRLANVCSYPSAGNGGNNNPFDCIVTPGVQYGTLRVTKVVTNDNGGTATAPDFSYSVDGGAAAAFPAGGTIDLTVPVGNHSVTETTIATGYTASYANSLNSNTNCTSLAVTAGQVTTCTITNNDQAATLIVKKLVINDNGGTKVATQFSFSVNNATAVSFLQDPNDADTKKGENTLTVNAGTYTVTEPAVSGYSTTYSSCTSVVIANGGTATCTITNNDNIAAPSISTVMEWTLKDRMVLTGYVSGGTGTNTATFTLYKDTATLTNCEASTQVSGYTPEVVNVDTNGRAATPLGYTTEVAGTYRWVVTYSGNSHNAGISSPCTGAGSEVTTLP